MKTCVAGCALALALLLQTSSAFAQEVHMTRSADGKTTLFSDRPLTGTQPVALRPINVMNPIPVAQSTQAQTVSAVMLSTSAEATSTQSTAARRSCGR